MEHTEKLISTRRIHEGRIINLREDTIQMPSGNIAKREIVEHNGAVCIVPVLADGRIAMVRQFRTAAGMDLLELPAGGLEKGEEAAACANRELSEECGYRARALTPLFTCLLAPGYSTEVMYGFLGEDLEEHREQADEDENLEIETFTLDELLPMIDDGRIRDSKTICGILAYYRKKN